jgi:hypothetical protein
MLRAKNTIPCLHCKKDFTQSRKDQKYCSATCRFEHFFENRDNKKARQDETIETLHAQVRDLTGKLQKATIPALRPRRGAAKIKETQQ